jgi:putative addiction module component (TIGR02574 family)
MSRDFNISQLSPAERLQLIEELWDSLAVDPDAVPVPPEHLQELNRRLDALDAGEMAPGEPWPIVTGRLSKR